LRFSEDTQAKALRCPRCATSVPLRVHVAPVEVVEEVIEEELPRPRKRMRRERARTWVMGPAIGMIAISSINILIGSFFAVIFIIGLFRLMGEPRLRIDFGSVVVSVLVFSVAMAINGFLLFAGIQMVSLSNYVVAMIGCVLLVIISSCGVITTIIGAAAPGMTVPGAGLARGRDLDSRIVPSHRPFWGHCVGTRGYSPRIFVRCGGITCRTSSPRRPRTSTLQTSSRRPRPCRRPLCRTRARRPCGTSFLIRHRSSDCRRARAETRLL
jgi:hypothetical protein